MQGAGGEKRGARAAAEHHGRHSQVLPVPKPTLEIEGGILLVTFMHGSWCACDSEARTPTTHWQANARFSLRVHVTASAARSARRAWDWATDERGRGASREGEGKEDIIWEIRGVLARWVEEEEEERALQSTNERGRRKLTVFAGELQRGLSFKSRMERFGPGAAGEGVSGCVGDSTPLGGRSVCCAVCCF